PHAISPTFTRLLPSNQGTGCIGRPPSASGSGDFMWQDLRYGLRSILNQRAFTALAVLTLALGIGAATTIFSVIQNVLLDPFPYKDSHRVVTFYIHDVKDRGPYGRSFFKPEEFLDYQEQARSFEEVIGSGVEDVLYTTAEGTV